MPYTKSFVLIGGSYGIGATLADILISNNYKVFVLSRSIPLNKEVIHISFDVTTDAINTADLPTRIDGMVYMPGSIQLKPFHRLTDDELLNDFKLNTLNAVSCIRTLLPLLKVSEQSSIVFFSTVAVQQGMPFHTSVAMAKGALEGLTRSLAAEFAPKIRVNAIAPSITDTPLASKILSNEEKKKISGERHPLKRVGQPGDIAKAAAFLLSDDSAWISGQVLHVDGGLSSLRI